VLKDQGRSGWYLGDGELAGLIREYDWAATALGSIKTWPPSLRTTVALLVNSPVPMVLLWGELGTMIYNDAYSEFAGGRHPRLLGSEVRKGWPEVAAFNDKVMRVGLAGGTLAYKDQELTLYRSGAPEQVWMNLDYSPVPDETGQPAGVIAIVIETTERVLADRRNEAERRRLEQMFEQGPSFMALLEGPDHRFELANPSYMNLIGGRDVLGKTVARALPEAVEQGYLALLDKVFASGQALALSASHFALQNPQGGPPADRYVDFIYQPLKDIAGNVTGIFVEGVDVTARMQAEAALHQLNETLEQQIEARTAQLLAREAVIATFYNHSSECHAVLKELPDGRFCYEEANPALLDLYGRTREELVGHALEDIFSPELARQLSTHLRACLQSGAPYFYERKNGDAVVEAVATPVPAGDRPGPPLGRQRPRRHATAQSGAATPAIAKNGSGRPAHRRSGA
jgi:PAS domain-containing protein